jgi:sucrose 6(F)-phosphate phosphorylase
VSFRNQVQLITYPDSLGGDLAHLAALLRSDLRGLFPGGVHVLPPFPSSGDRGFAPLTYDEIEPSFGTWGDLRQVGQGGPVMLDLMVNHMSRQSPAARDFLAHGRRSAYADLFLSPRKVWPAGGPPEEDLRKLFLRRVSPFSRYRTGDSDEEVELWTTFGRQDPSEQIDLDWRSAAYRHFITAALDGFQRRGISLLRLDAVAYVVKEPGTSCFFVEPGIWQYLEWITGLASARGIELLPEVHARPAVQEALSARGYWIYDFVLPYRILEAVLTGEPAALKDYISRRPPRQITMLDCHDGIPVKPDLDGLYEPGKVRRVVDMCMERGANLSRIVSASHKDPDGFDVHQVRCSWYSALGEDDEACVAARALQLFVPGVPQVYYGGLLAGKNDEEAVRRSGEGREINRHNYTSMEIAANLRREVVQRLMRLVRLRNEHPAFGGTFYVLPSRDNQIILKWQKDAAACTLMVDLSSRASVVESDLGNGSVTKERL